MIDQLLPLLLHADVLFFWGKTVEFVARFHETDHPGNARIRKTVKNVLAALVTLHDMRFLQNVQMLADRGKLLAGSGDEITDAEFLPLQIFRNPEPGRMSQRLEYLREVGKFSGFIVCD